VLVGNNRGRARVACRELRPRLRAVPLATAEKAGATSEFVEISRFGLLRTKADNFREIGRGELKLTTVQHDSLTVRIHGEVGVLQGIADHTGAYRGMRFGGKLRYTRVLVRRAGRWQAVAMQHTMMA